MWMLGSTALRRFTPASSFCLSSDVYHGTSGLSAPELSCSIDRDGIITQLARISNHTRESVGDGQRTQSVSFCQGCFLYSCGLVRGNRGEPPYVDWISLLKITIQRVKKNRDDLRDLAECIVDIITIIHDELITRQDCASRFSEMCIDFNE